MVGICFNKVAIQEVFSSGYIGLTFSLFFVFLVSKL